MRRILIFMPSRDSSPASTPDPALALAEALDPHRFACEILYGSFSVGTRASSVPMGWPDLTAVAAATIPRSEGPGVAVPAHRVGSINGVPVTALGVPSPTLLGVGDGGQAGFFALLDATLGRLRPDVVVALGGGRPSLGVLARGRARGAATVLWLDDPDWRDAGPPTALPADAVVVSSDFFAAYCRESYGLSCNVLPPAVTARGPVIERAGPGYLTFLDPTPARGAFPFARIAHELGRVRPDIPILVVEGRGTEGDLASCGLALQEHGNLSVMGPPPDLRDVWAVTRAFLAPSLGWAASMPEVAGALANGIPVIASDRGGLPEALGESGIILALPDRLTPATRRLPTAEEVAPWVEAVVRLWDDADFAEDRSRRATAEARRRTAEDGKEIVRRFFEELQPGAGQPAATPRGRAMSVVLVPHLNGIDWECEQGLRRLEEGGVKVIRRGGSSAIDAARNQLVSDALHDGFESVMFIDADVGFNPLDVFRLLARPEPVVCGIYAKKGRRGLATHFAEGLSEILFGPDAPGPYPVRFAATGFLRVKAAILRRMIAELGLPLCNTKWGRGVWPFFQPMIVPHDGDRHHYLGEDWAFSYRLGQIGVTPLADTTIRLWHWGRHAYGWEDAGSDRPRYRSYNFRLPED